MLKRERVERIFFILPACLRWLWIELQRTFASWIPLSTLQYFAPWLALLTVCRLWCLWVWPACFWWQDVSKSVKYLAGLNYAYLVFLFLCFGSLICEIVIDDRLDRSRCTIFSAKSHTVSRTSFSEYLATWRLAVVFWDKGNLVLVSEIGQVASISNLLLTRKFIHFGKIFTLSLALRGLPRAPSA